MLNLSYTTSKSSYGKAAGHDLQRGIMILALAMGHTVERPAIRMEGGTKTYEAALPAAVCPAFEKTCTTGKFCADLTTFYAVFYSHNLTRYAENVIIIVE